MKEEFCRTALLLGKDGVERLSQAKVAVFGVGGVGSYCVEALARAGIGTLILFDSDRIAVSNINRQLIALHSTVGMLKTEVAARRIADINPDCHVIQYPVFFLPENAAQYDLSGCSYIVDAVDTVAAKLSIIQLAMEKDIPVISCMGAGNKLDPSQFRIGDISKTEGCPLARVVRKELRARGIHRHRVLWSPEEPKSAIQHEAPPPGRRSVPGSVAWVPPVAGLMMAGEVICSLINTQR